MRTNFTRRALTSFTILILFAALVAASASAGLSRTINSGPASSVVVEIPFEFTVAGHTLPAGESLVQRSTLVSTEGLTIRSLDKGAGVFVLTTSVQSNERQKDSRLVFNRYGDKYFLSQLWTSGEAGGRALIKTSQERNLERNLAKNGTKPVLVAIFLHEK